MTIKLRSVGEYRRAIVALRKYADGFGAADGYDLRNLQNQYVNPLTSSQRARIRSYFDVLQRHAGYKGATYQHFRDPVKLRNAQKAMGMPTKGSWRGVFVPQPSEDTPAHLRQFGTGKNAAWVVEYRAQGVDKVFVPFDRELFANMGVEYVRALFARLPKSYHYVLAMGHESRERWHMGGNLEQMLRDLSHFVSGYSGGRSERSGALFSEYLTGVWVYRGGQKKFNVLKKELYKTQKEKRTTQEQIKKLVRKERRELNDYKEYLRLLKKFGRFES